MEAEDLQFDLRGFAFYEDPELGQVVFQRKRNVKNFIARFKDGGVRVSVPLAASVEAIMESFKKLKPRLIAKRERTPDIAFRDGQRLEFVDFNITIGTQSIKPNSVLIKFGMPDCYIQVGTDFDFNDVRTTKIVSKAMKRIASYFAEPILFARAMKIAAILRLRPLDYHISDGYATLGTCSRNRQIKLSSALMFLPEDLRDYVIYHEMAHLTHMNHSAQFHALCDRYCNGREKELKSRLDRFAWPLLK